MLTPRIIPVLQISNHRLVKSIAFRKRIYIGDPYNTVQMFNDFQVDELMLLDIDASAKGSRPDFALLRTLAKSSFVPLAYGGGIRDTADAENVLRLGFEKVVMNTAAFRDVGLIKKLSTQFGSQAVCVSIDYTTAMFSNETRVKIQSGRINTGIDALTCALRAQDFGAGEVLITSISREGSMSGFDLEFLKDVSNKLDIPVIAHGGGGTDQHIRDAVDAGASAVGIGAMTVFSQKEQGVLINYPNPFESIPN